MRILSSLYFFILSLILGLPSAWAASDTHVIHVDVEASFVPKNAIFFVTLNEQPQLLVQQGLMLPSDSDNDRKVQVATVLKHSKPVNKINYSVLLMGDDKKFLFHDLPTLVVGSDSLTSISASTLRDYLLGKKGQLSELQVTNEEDGQEIRRLRSDAEVIGNLGRITQRMEEVSIMREQRKQITEDAERLETFIQQAAVQPEPNNFIRRQSQLTSQLEELAQVVQSVEQDESTRRSFSEAQLQRQLALIEETRTASVPELQAQLATLQKASRRLEKQLGFDKGEAVEDYLSW